MRLAQSAVFSVGSATHSFFFPPSLKGFRRFVTAASGSLVYFRNYVGSTSFFFCTRYNYYHVLCSCFCLNKREKKNTLSLVFCFLYSRNYEDRKRYVLFLWCVTTTTYATPPPVASESAVFFFTIHLAFFFFIKLEKRQDKSTLKHTHTHAVKTKLFDRTKSRNCS